MLKLRNLVVLQSKKYILLVLVFSFLSFVFGNIFGLNFQNLFLNSPGILFFICPLLLEIVNFFIFVFNTKNFFPFNEKRKFFCFFEQKKDNLLFQQEKQANKNNFYLIMISIRRGFLLGIFIEAFKVGS